MAFKPQNADYMVGSRGIAGMMVYTDQEHTISQIRTSGFFDHNEVRSFVRHQREKAGANQAINGVPVLAYGNNGGDLFWITVTDAGVVAPKAAGWQLKA